MTSNIQDLLLKLPAVVSVSIECSARNPMLYPMKEAVGMLQLTFYWWKEAAKEMESYQQGVEITQTVPLIDENSYIKRPVTPTLIGAKEQLEFIKKELREISKATNDLIYSVSLPPVVQHGVQQGYNKIMDALFNTEISTLYYEQLNSRNESENQQRRGTSFPGANPGTGSIPSV